MDENTSLKDEVRALRETMEGATKKKQARKFSLPFRSRVSKPLLNKGYVTVQVLNENRSLEFRREPIVDGTIKLDDTYHAVDDLDIFFYKGKPFVHQKKTEIYSYNPIVSQADPSIGGNATYGQKYIMSRMETDRLEQKKRIGLGGMAIFGLIIAAVVAYYFFSGGTTG